MIYAWIILAAAGAKGSETDMGMTDQAWVFMLSVWAIIIGSTAYCFLKLMTSKRQLDSEADEPQVESNVSSESEADAGEPSDAITTRPMETASDPEDSPDTSAQNEEAPNEDESPSEGREL